MSKRIAVEEGLSQVRDMLQNNGYEVVRLDPSQMREAAAIVISGGDKNMMGIETIQTGAPVINAEGLSAEEVFSQVNRSVGV
jgi:hypothetical protein